MNLQELPYKEQLLALLDKFQIWLFANVFVWNTVVQITILLLVLFSSFLLRGKLHRWVMAARLPGSLARFSTRFQEFMLPLVVPFYLLLLLWFSVFALDRVGAGNQFLNLVVSLLNVWVVIRLAASFISSPGWRKFISTLAWGIAALNIIGLLDVTSQFLDSLSFSFGAMKFSALGLIKGVIAVSILFWVFSLLEKAVRKRLDGVTSLTPSAKVLLNKFLRIALIIAGVLVGLDAMGMDLTALAVFSGAIGIGLGFGLQKVAANLVSGFILLLDHSVKPGDVISLGNTYGKIDKLGGRYVSVITRDGTETLIPNEELITQRVENWSFTDTNVRQRATISVDYSTDLDLAIRLAEEAANEIPRIVKEPASRCLLRDFGADGVTIELRYWVSDAHNGLGSVRSDVLMSIWRKYHEHGVSFPYPQRDLHIKGTVPIRMERAPQTRTPATTTEDA